MNQENSTITITEEITEIEAIENSEEIKDQEVKDLQNQEFEVAEPTSDSEFSPNPEEIAKADELTITPEEEEVAKAPNPVITDIPEFVPELDMLIKALIFASPEYLNVKSIKEIIEDTDAKKIRSAIARLNKKMRAENEPFEIIEVNNSFRFRTVSQFYPWLKKLFKEQTARRLSNAALEILSIVAYKQPITKAEIEDLRGVNIDGTIKGLIDKKLVTITGRSAKVGNAFTYSTTKEFLQYFNINKIPDDLPKLSEFENMISNSALIPQISKEGDIIHIEQNLAEE